MAEILKIIVSLGVPGLALWVLYLLAKRWGFRTSEIPPVLSGIIFLVVVLVVGFLIYTALDRFTTPDGNNPPRVSHEGELQNLILQLSRDSNASVNLKLAGSSEEQSVLGKLYFENTNAPSYGALIEKMCLAQSQCIKCEEEANVVTVRKVGEIQPNCKDEGQAVFCCA